MTFSKQVPATIETQNRKIPDIPDFSFTNPLKKNMFVNGIEIINTPEFSRKGVIIIAVDNNILFDSRDTDGFSNVAFMPINLNAVFERDRIVTVSAFNQVDDNKIKVTINVFVDEVERTLSSALQYFSQDVVNTIVSDVDDVIFPKQARPVGTFTQLIDMKGYKKLIVTISGQDPDLEFATPTITNAFFINPTNLSNVVDGDLASQTGQFTVNLAITPVGEIKTDSGANTTKDLKAKINHLVGGGSAGNVELSTSPDDIVYTVKATASTTSTFPQTITLDGTLHSFRFVKLKFTCTLGVYNGNIFEIYDANKIGGTAAISLETKDALGNWSLFIAASEFGTVSTGTPVTQQVGDNNLSVTGKTYGLPSTQTSFRAKYTITNGGIENSVSVIKVS